MFPLFCYLPHWLWQETSEGKKCHLLEATAAAKLNLVWCLDSEAEESINKNWATKCLKVLVWWSQAHLHMRWNQTCNFFEGFCWVWVFGSVLILTPTWRWPDLCMCLLHTHVLIVPASSIGSRKLHIGCATFSEVTLLVLEKGKSGWFLKWPV